MFCINGRHSMAVFANPGWIKPIVDAEKEVSVKKHYNAYEAYTHAARKYQSDNYVDGGELLPVPDLAWFELNPWYRDKFHDGALVSGNRVFLVTSGAVGKVGIFTDLNLIGTVFIDAPVGTEAYEVPDVATAIGKIQTYVAENVLAFSGYFPIEEFRMLQNLPLNEMVQLPYGAWMRANCILPPALQPFSPFGYAEPSLSPAGTTPKPLPLSGSLMSNAEEGGENDVV